MLAQLTIKDWTDMPSPICATCKKAIVGPRLIVNEQWRCSTCAYWLDQGKTPPGLERDKG